MVSGIGLRPKDAISVGLVPNPHYKSNARAHRLHACPGPKLAGLVHKDPFAYCQLLHISPYDPSDQSDLHRISGTNPVDRTLIRLNPIGIGHTSDEHDGALELLD